MNATTAGFSVRMVGNQPNLVKNPGFESAVSRAAMSATGAYRAPHVSPDAQQRDGRGARGSYVGRVAIGGTAPKTSPIAYQTIAVSTSTNYTITARSTSRAWGRTRPRPRHADVQVGSRAGSRPHRAARSSNAVLRTYWVYAYTGTAGWHHNATGIKTMSNATKVRLAIGVRSGYGTVLFDDISLTVCSRRARPRCR
jgi:hypothetical protein